MEFKPSVAFSSVQLAYCGAKGLRPSPTHIKSLRAGREAPAQNLQRPASLALARAACNVALRIHDQETGKMTAGA
jgi:hypothetical protein